MKKLKLEELEVKSLTTSLQESADETKGGTTPAISYVVSGAVISYIFLSPTPAY